MNILIVTSEYAGIAKAGGLADAVTALSSSIAEFNHDVRVTLPFYGSIDSKQLLDIKLIKKGQFAFANHKLWYKIYELQQNGIKIYLIDNPILFRQKNGIYTNIHNDDFPDNLLRFSFFSAISLNLPSLIGWQPDIFHCHDWATAPLILFLKTGQYAPQGYNKIRSVFSIHNIGYQGVFTLDKASSIGMSPEAMQDLDIITGGAINLMRGALLHADAITTVSPSYAREIRDTELGYSMETILKKRQDCFFGIINGMDYSVWNPQTDRFLPVNFSYKSIEKKKIVKTYLKNKIGLSTDEDRPLVGMVTRLVHQKGLELLTEPFPGILSKILEDLNIDMVILGTGEGKYHIQLSKIAETHSNLAVRLEFNEELAHLIEAGSDFFLMPSIYEPCGLNQMYSLAYGTIPIVSHRGGLIDTVEEKDMEKGRGTGFFIEPLTKENIYKTIQRAVSLYYSDPEIIKKIRINAMKKRFDWKKSAKQYVKIYKKIIRSN
ncbi:glycogen/starch synthase [Spirochaetia bacterium 38H-sp]|uniref:Glycogen synthase n=1 Tax=Rarispira pelagica TaxID=3141764 RepID=A0ABU9UD24_9SPIR